VLAAVVRVRMWRAHLGSDVPAGTRCSSCDCQASHGFVSNAAPLQVEVERIRRVCAKVALEHATLASLIPRLRKENNTLRASLADRNKKFECKVDRLTETCQLLRTELDRLLAAYLGISRQMSGESNLGKEASSQRARSPTATIATVEHEKACEDVDDIIDEVRLSDREIQQLRSRMEREHESLASRIDGVSEKLTQAMDSKVSLLQATLGSTLNRLATRSRERETAGEEENAALMAKLREEREERLELENRCIRLESRLAEQEKVLARMAEQQCEQEEQHTAGSAFYLPSPSTERMQFTPSRLAF